MWVVSIMASQVAADSCEPPVKRLKVVSETIQTDPECPLSCLESPLDDSNTFDDLHGKFRGFIDEKCFWVKAFGLKTKMASFFAKVRRRGCVDKLWQVRRRWLLRIKCQSANFLVITSTNDNMPTFTNFQCTQILWQRSNQRWHSTELNCTT